MTPGPYIENGTDPNSCEIFVGTRDGLLKENEIEIIFHAANRALEVINPQRNKAKLTFFNTDGQLIFSEKITAGSHFFEIPVIAQGIYFTSISTERGETYSRKISIF